MYRSNPILLNRYKTCARIVACIVILGSILVLVGWATNETQLMCLWPDFGGKHLKFMGRVHSSAAISLILFSVALMLIMMDRASKWFRITGEIIAGVGLLGMAIATYFTMTGQDIETIRILQPDPAAVGITYPTPIAVEIGFELTLIGLALLLFRIKTKGSFTLAQIAIIAAIPIPLLIFLGAATEITELCVMGGCFTMSTQFAVLALLLCSAVFLSHPDEGLAAMYSSSLTGGMILRRATLFLCAIPPLLIVRTILTHLPMLEISPEVGWVIFVFLFLATAIAFIVPNIKAFNAIEHDLSNQLIFTRDELERTRQSRSLMEMAGGITGGSMTIRYKRICLTCTSEFDDSHENCPNDKTPLSRVIDDSLIGVTFADKYDITEMLGTGGMSTVYKATHRYLNKEVAVKVLKGNAASSTDGLKRFQREARATSAVSHPGVVAISDFGLSPDGRAFLVMDYLNGESISSLLDRVGPLRLPMMIALSCQICEALAAAHERGVVHRDLKPSNIMLVNNEDGTAQAKIVDFGLAKIMEEDSHLSMKITQTGECFGSPLYMSPEQCMGKKVDHRSDIYALGAILYELLTGYPPIMGQNAADTVRRQVTDRPSPIPQEVNVPMEIKLMIYKCLHKDANWRPQTAMQVYDVLSRTPVNV